MSKLDIIALSGVVYMRYLVNRARWLDHYYRMKCEISAEDASWKIWT